LIMLKNPKEQRSTVATDCKPLNCWWKNHYKYAFQCFHQLSQQGHSVLIIFEGILEYLEKIFN
jgi:hypothetical protein